MAYLLDLMGVTPAVHAAANAFLRVSFLSLPFALLISCFSRCCAAWGR